MSDPHIEDHDHTKVPPHVGHVVTVVVDGAPKHVPGGEYLVSAFKTLVGVSADRELDLVRKDELVALGDAAEVHIKDGERFVSHVRAGSSS